MDLEDIKNYVYLHIDSAFTKLDKIMSAHMQTISQLEANVSFYKSKCDTYEELQNKLYYEQKELQQQVANLQKEVEAGKITISKLEEDTRNLQRVSQIIAYEKENAKLRMELQMANERIIKLNTKPQSKKEISDGSDERDELDERDVNGETAECEHKAEELIEDKDEAPVEVYEKKINKVWYFISDDDSMRIYRKTDEGEMGEELGQLVRDPNSNKLKAVWL
jgi:chromosome segregation ATPase